ncbi:MAG: VOC family protein [Anaerolineales bacterium]|nr:VOC family protein [Anaerolineales bacterium]
MPRVVHFEFHADEPERAIKFYEGVFGWKITKWDGPVDYWLVYTGEEGEPGIDGAITKREESGAQTWNTVDVEDLDEYVKKVEQNGGKVVEPKTAVPGVGYMAYCQDSEGNIFGMMQSDPEAK